MLQVSRCQCQLRPCVHESDMSGDSLFLVHTCDGVSGSFHADPADLHVNGCRSENWLRPENGTRVMMFIGVTVATLSSFAL